MEGRQEADAVIEGGGIHVVALAGAMQEFEERGFKPWRDVAGVGAGSILAAYLATGHDAKEAVALLTKTPWERFLDWGRGGRMLGGYWNFLRRGALARGEALTRWFDEVVLGATFAHVQGRAHDSGYRLVLVAYDYTHSRLLLLPDDLRLYRAPARSSPLEPELVRIADGVRMAMAIRGLFPPVELVELETGERSWIVDASPHSNFPVWLFDRADGLPQRPTFGFRVIRGRFPAQPPRQQRLQEEEQSGLGWRAALGPDPFQTTPLRWDEREQSELTLVRACLVPVPGVEVDDFSVSSERQEWLLAAGRDAARAFLERFSVDEYTNTYRRHLKTVGALQVPEL